MIIENINLKFNNKTLTGIITRPIDETKKYPVVIIIHGLGSNIYKDSYVDLGNILAENKIISIRFNYNGGQEDIKDYRDFSILTEKDKTKYIKEVVVDKLEYIDKNKIFLLGKSFGGVVSSILAGENDTLNIKGLILIAPAGIIVDAARLGKFKNLTVDLNNLPDKIYLNENLFIGKKFIEDIKELDIYNCAEKYKGPVLIIHGTDDEIVDIKYSEKYKNIYEKSNFITLPGGHHTFTKNEEIFINKKIIEFIVQNNH